MKTLLILRHAKSSWDNPNLTDHDRPLKDRGKRDAPRMGDLIRQRDLVPELLISSTAKRACQTAELVADACAYEEDLIATRFFYPGDVEDYIEVLQRIPGDYGHDYERVMVVGHNPGLESLLYHLTGEWERMPTAALAEVRLPLTSWAELTMLTEGELVNLWEPKALP